MSEYVAVDGCKLDFKSSTHSGSISITNDPSDVVKCDGKNTFIGQIAFSVSGFTGGAITNGDGTGSGIILGGSQKCTSGNQPIVLENDNITILVTGTAGEGQSKHAETANVEVYVKDAGQSVCKMT